MDGKVSVISPNKKIQSLLKKLGNWKYDKGNDALTITKKKGNPIMPKLYRCPKCKHTHEKGSKIFRKHLKYLEKRKSNPLSNKLNEIAFERYGKTTNPFEGAFITLEGEIIQNAELGDYKINHREIAGYVYDIAYEPGGDWRWVNKFILETGDIRLATHENKIFIEISLSQVLTKKQFEIIKLIYTDLNIEYDFSNNKGGIIFSGKGDYYKFKREYLEQYQKYHLKSKSKKKNPLSWPHYLSFMSKRGYTRDEISTMWATYKVQKNPRRKFRIPKRRKDTQTKRKKRTKPVPPKSWWDMMLPILEEQYSGRSQKDYNELRGGIWFNNYSAKTRRDVAKQFS